MKSVYLESSCLLAWLLGEPQSKKILSILNKADVIATSVLTFIEAERGLLRGELAGNLKAAERKKLLGMLKKAAYGWTRMEITEEVQTRAKKRFPNEPIRSLDAIHLASIMEFLEIFPQMTVLSLDHRILSNLEPLGLGSVPFR